MPFVRGELSFPKALADAGNAGGDEIGKQGIGISKTIFRCSLLGFPQAPDWPQSVQSNTPDGVAFPLPSVAPSCTSAQEKRGAAAPRQECAGSGTISLRETEPVIGSSAMISRLIFCRQPAERQRGLPESGCGPAYNFCSRSCWRRQ